MTGEKQRRNAVLSVKTCSIPLAIVLLHKNKGILEDNDHILTTRTHRRATVKIL